MCDGRRLRVDDTASQNAINDDALKWDAARTRRRRWYYRR
jgi:hypothetical protein